jgi:hypothetical protein
VYVSNLGNPEIALRALTSTQAPAEEAGLVLSPMQPGRQWRGDGMSAPVGMIEWAVCNFLFGFYFCWLLLAFYVDHEGVRCFLRLSFLLDFCALLQESCTLSESEFSELWNGQDPGTFLKKVCFG